MSEVERLRAVTAAETKWLEAVERRRAHLRSVGWNGESALSDEVKWARQDFEAAAIAFCRTDAPALLARLEACEANDRRYRWLRDEAMHASGALPCAYAWTASAQLMLISGNDLDAAIDAVRERA